ncbi:hypothetical protein B0H17DRAFT_1087906, partial [Mycena rosella]
MRILSFETFIFQFISLFFIPSGCAARAQRASDRNHGGGLIYPTAPASNPMQAPAHGRIKLHTDTNRPWTYAQH